MRKYSAQLNADERVDEAGGGDTERVGCRVVPELINKVEKLEPLLCLLRLVLLQQDDICYVLRGFNLR